MARQAKDFAIEAQGPISVHASAGRVRIGDHAWVASRFSTWVVLGQPRLRIALDIQVNGPGQTEIIELSVRPDITGASRIASSTLRRIPVDQIVRAVLVEAARVEAGKVVDRSDVIAGGYQLEGDAEDAFRLGPVPAGQQRAKWAARIYARAIWSGARAPTEAVAEEMKVSRTQASRHIRAAREADPPLLPAPGEYIPDPDHQRLIGMWGMLRQSIDANKEAAQNATSDAERTEFASRIEDLAARLRKTEDALRQHRQQQRARGVTPEPLPAQLATLDAPE